jgi:hypothetical protein
MGSPALNYWTLAAIAALVAVASMARLAAADSGEARFAAGADLEMFMSSRCSLAGGRTRPRCRSRWTRGRP